MLRMVITDKIVVDCIRHCPREERNSYLLNCSLVLVSNCIDIQCSHAINRMLTYLNNIKISILYRLNRFLIFYNRNYDRRFIFNRPALYFKLAL